MSFMEKAFSQLEHHVQTKVGQRGNFIKGVYWAGTPWFAEPNKKNTPAQTTGLRYERKVEQKLITLATSFRFELVSHKWIGYNGDLFAQPDFVLISPSGAAILIEVKYTYTDTSNQRKLYTRLLKELGLNPITSFTICHNLTSETPRDKIIHNFHDLQQDSIWQLRI